MNSEKITVSLDEVNSSRVDEELHRQDVASRMAEHQEKIRLDYGGSGEMLGSKPGFFRKAMVYMAVFGFVFSVLGWGVSELFFSDLEAKSEYLTVVDFLVREQGKQYPKMSWDEFKKGVADIRRGGADIEKDPLFPYVKDNPYLTDEFLGSSLEEWRQNQSKVRAEIGKLNMQWYVCIAVFIAIGLSIAEGCVSKNFILVVKNGIVGLILGVLGGFGVSLFADRLYNFLGGGLQDSINFKQIVARAIAWAVLGLFMAIAPGISMKSWKKVLLGCAGGALGGFVGGVLFDPISEIFKSVALARFVNIVGMGVSAAVATVILENIAKQGWLKVAAGVIAGKQFILYRNPTVIGSSPKSEIYLFKDPQIASRHAAINNHNGEFVISAIDGSPVYVNNQSVGQHRLKTGDQIRIGNTVFVFEAKVLERARG